MDILTTIKKNAGWYTLSMVLTGVVSFIAIVITKQLFPSDIFISFNLKFNGVFVLNSISATWLSISILRMYHNMEKFFRVDNLVLLSFATTIFFSWPLYITWYFLTQLSGDIILPMVLLGVTLIHAIFIVTHQARSNARVVAQSEAVRGFIILACLLIPVFFKIHPSEIYFWISWIIAYLICIALLYQSHNKIKYFEKGDTVGLWKEYKANLKKVAVYGMPLTIWMLFSFLLTYVDRIYLARSSFDVTLSSDYLALADVITRGCGFLFIPINTSVYPIISRQFDEGDIQGTGMLIKKVLKIQAGLVAISGIFLVIITPIITNLLNLSTNKWLYNAVFIILFLLVFSFWQSCGMIQKPLELNRKTLWLAFMIAFCTLISYLSVFVIFKPMHPFSLIASMFTGILLYFVIALGLLKKFLNQNHRPASV